MIKLNQYSWDPEKDLIAAGAFAEVFKATDAHSGRHVALKVYKEAVSKGTTSGTEGKKKYTLEKEFETVNGLSHTNLITYFGLTYLEGTDQLGRKSSYPVIVMELAPHGTLTDFMKSNPSPSEVERIIKQVIAGVGYLHEEGIIHRDLKPGNILIAQNRKGQPVAKITDFGISKDILTEHTIEQSYTEGVGTPHYMAPEQFYKKKFGLKGEISERTDLWAVGVIVYTMLTGKRPFGSKSKDYELIREQIVNLTPDLSALDEKGKALVQSTMAKNANDRVGSAEELNEIYSTGQSAFNWDEQKEEEINDEPQTVVNNVVEEEEEPELATAVMDQPKATPTPKPSSPKTSAGTRGNKAKDRAPKKNAPVKQKKSRTGLIAFVVFLVIGAAAVALAMPELFSDEETDRYNELVAEGDNFMNRDLLDSARMRYDSAKVFKPESQEIVTKIDDLERKAQYNALITSADELLEENKTSEAIAKYQEAEGLIPSDELENKISELQSDQQFKSLLAQGDRLLAQGNKDGAIGKYEEARVLRPTDKTIPIKISNANAQQANKDLLAGIKNGNLELMRTGLSAGAQLTGEASYYETLIEKNCLDCLKLMFSNGYDPRTSLTRYSNALKFASSYGRLGIVRYLNQNYFTVDERPNQASYTPLMNAVDNNHLQTARYLLNSGADAKATTSSDIIPWDLADSDEMRSLLTEFGGAGYIAFEGFDDFSDEKKSWTRSGSDFVFESYDDNYTYPYAIVHSVDTEQGFDAQVTVKFEGGDNTRGFGLIFAGKSTQDYYVFAISNNGSYAIYYYADNEWTNIQNWISRTLITSDTPHELRVVNSGSNVSFYIDGSLIQSKSASDFANFGPRFGTWSTGAVKKVRFSDFSVSEY